MSEVECSVQNKIKCVFATNILDGKTAKRSGQNYQVLATEQLSEEAVNAHVDDAVVSEKIDGTCCYVVEYQGASPGVWLCVFHFHIV